MQIILERKLVLLNSAQVGNLKWYTKPTVAWKFEYSLSTHTWPTSIQNVYSTTVPNVRLLVFQPLFCWRNNCSEQINSSSHSNIPDFRLKCGIFRTTADRLSTHVWPNSVQYLHTVHLFCLRNDCHEQVNTREYKMALYWITWYKLSQCHRHYSSTHIWPNSVQYLYAVPLGCLRNNCNEQINAREYVMDHNWTTQYMYFHNVTILSRTLHASRTLHEYWLLL